MIGYLSAEYKVISYEDVQANSSSAASIKLNQLKQYVLHCTQKILLQNPNMGSCLTFMDYDPNGFFPFENYPVLLQPSVLLQLTNGNGIPAGVTIRLLDYSPKTVNSKIQTSRSANSGLSTGLSNSTSNTIGSSFSDTNSFGVSVGLNGDIPSISANYDYSETSGHDKSQSWDRDRSTQNSSEIADSTGMSIKDWGVYATCNSTSQSPTWFFGQQYPWDVFNNRTFKMNNSSTIPNPAPTDKNPYASTQFELVISADTSALMYDSTNSVLLPPSELSQMGVCFTTKCAWLVTIDYTQTGVSDNFTANHNVSYAAASHSIQNDGSLGVFIDNQMTILNAAQKITKMETNLELGLMALIALGLSNTPAITSFVSNKFTILPQMNPFLIYSSGDNLLIRDSTDYAGSYPAHPPFSLLKNCLAATFTSANQSSINFTVYFKVADKLLDYNLHLKHWLLNDSSTDIMLTITINGDTNNQIVKFVSSTEGAGGEENLLTIALRNQNFNSIDYHDYLKLGLNCINISIAPTIVLATEQSSTYMLKALSVEKA